ncbi:MAG: hypothetical protein WDO19_21840 [Bacteroidota bacterium]
MPTAFKTVSKLEYNELGQLKKKDAGNNPTPPPVRRWQNRNTNTISGGGCYL